jgi:uncharacterized protein YndB with AHSA1/START domain
MTINSTNTIRLHRVLRAAPEKIYRAFLDADAMAKWLPPNGFTGKVHQMDARVGGAYRMSFTNFTTGKSHSFGGTYVELKPHERIRYTDKFDDPKLAWRNADDRNSQTSCLRDGVEHRARRRAQRDSCGSLLSWLAGIARAVGEAGGGGHPRLTLLRNLGG